MLLGVATLTVQLVQLNMQINSETKINVLPLRRDVTLEEEKGEP